MSSKDFRFGISSSAQGVDLNQVLIEHGLSTYFMRVATDIPELGLSADDVLIVDRSLSPKKKDIVVVASSDDPELKIIQFETIHGEFELWGVGIHLIRGLR